MKDSLAGDEPFDRYYAERMVAETYYRENANGKETWFNPAD